MVSYLAINFITTMQGAIVAKCRYHDAWFCAIYTYKLGSYVKQCDPQGLSNPDATYYLLAPIVCLGLFQMGCIFFASGIDDALNPRLRNR